MHTMQDKKGIKLKYACMAGIAILLAVSMFYALLKPVAIVVDGDRIETRVLCNQTVDQVLKKQEIILGPHDKVTPSLDSIISRNGSIEIIRAHKLTVIYAGEEKEIITTPIPVKEAIALAGFKLGPQDIIKTQAVEKTVPDQVIEVIQFPASTLSSAPRNRTSITAASARVILRSNSKPLSVPRKSPRCFNISACS
jgi:uncharacterized protein YabE (DUF348 family)